MMKQLGWIGAAVLPLLSFVGCVAIRVSRPDSADMRLQEKTRSFVQSEVSGVEPTLVRTDEVLSVDVSLLGAFDVETRAVYASAFDWDEFVAVGFFPGTMSCRGEYQDCLKNALCACGYNVVFAGLPTVYGLLFEPLIPHYPRQTDSLVGRSAFAKSALLGFSRYSKPAVAQKRQTLSHSKLDKVRLEDAIILSPDLGIESERGQPLQIPVSRVPGSGEFKVKLKLPEEHPLKGAMSGYEDAEITVLSENKTGGLK